MDRAAGVPAADAEVRGLLLQPRREWNKGVAINYKKHGGESFPDRAGVLDIERGQLAAIRPYFWQTDTSVSKNSWGYVTNQDYKTVDSIVDDLIDIVSKNGSLLLNIGPKPDGTIPEPEQQMLRAIGKWLAVNGEAIYGTRPWTVFGEGPTAVVEGPFADTKRQAFTPRDVRFTKKGNDALRDSPGVAGGRARHHHVAGDWRTERALARLRTCRSSDRRRRSSWTRDASGLHVTLPSTAPSDYAAALRLTLQ